MKSADADLNARQAQRARDVHRPRKLVRLDADEADQPATAVVAYLPDDLARIDPRVGFVIGAQAELDIVAQNLAGGRVRRKSVERRQGIGRHDRTEPLDDVTVVVIVRRLDENEMKYPRLAVGRQCERHRYTSSASSRETGGAGDERPSQACRRTRVRARGIELSWYRSRSRPVGERRRLQPSRVSGRLFA